MNLMRYCISLWVDNFEYCCGESPLFVNGELKTFPTEDMAKQWIKENPELVNSLYTIKPI